ncbi:unnamed protein product [Calicophoron daubneyi]|uniref:Uncharacterized protein n=1 Tax=Calicophoron daubneyi TaxID=300641 RepID=A0AAV2TM36_CALDB
METEMSAMTPAVAADTCTTSTDLKSSRREITAISVKNVASPLDAAGLMRRDGAAVASEAVTLQTFQKSSDGFQETLITANRTVKAERAKRPSIGQAIGFGILATTTITLCALVGFVFSFLQRYKIYPVIISFMVAMSAGSLFSGATISLLPEALELAAVSQHADLEEEYWYIPVSVATCSGSFLFFILEFVLTRVRLRLQQRTPKAAGLSLEHFDVARRLATGSGKQHRFEVKPLVDGSRKVGREGMYHTASKNGLCKLPLYRMKENSTKTPEVESEASPRSTNQGRRPSVFDEVPQKVDFRSQNLCIKLSSLDPVVWMLIIGDGVHNFVDGLFIGASFNRRIKLGISFSLGVFCGRFPHELAASAVLLRAGMSVPLAVLFSFCTACITYVGFFIGVFMGELPSASTYIFAVTTGFFLHLSLANMLTEMRKTEKMLKDDTKQMLILFFVHCSGLLFGFGFKLFLSLSAGHIFV